MVIKNDSTPPEEIDDLTLSQNAEKKIAESKNIQSKLRILKSLFKLDAPWTYSVILNSLAEPSEEIRRFIVERLARKETLDLDLLYHRLLRPPWHIKIEILKILGLRKEPSAIKFIEVVLQDTNAEVRRTAASVLGEIGGESAKNLLVKLTQDSNPFVRKAAEKELSRTSELKFL